MNVAADRREIALFLIQTAAERGLCPHDTIFALVQAASVLDVRMVDATGMPTILPYAVATATTGGPWAVHAMLDSLSHFEEAAEAEEQSRMPEAKSDPTLN